MKATRFVAARRSTLHFGLGFGSVYVLPEANTIEEKIIELQEKKQTVFDCTVGNSNQALAQPFQLNQFVITALAPGQALQRLTAEDIQFLFRSWGMFSIAASRTFSSLAIRCLRGQAAAEQNGFPPSGAPGV